MTGAGPGGERRRGVEAMLGAVLVVATLGQGGAAPPALLAVHGGVVAMVILAVSGAHRPRWTVPAGPRGAALALFALVLVSAATAPYGYAAVAACLRMAAFAAVAVVASWSGPGLPGRLVPWLATGIGVQAGVVAAQRIVGGTPRPAGTFLNPNHLGGWSVAVLVLVLGGLVDERPSRTAVGRVLLAAPVALILFLGGSRGALLATVVGLGWLAMLGWRRLEGRHRATAAAAMAAVAALATVGVGLRSTGHDPFRYYRPRIWRSVLGAALDHPWAGVGPGQWDAVSNRYSFPVEDGPLRFERVVDSTHSDVLLLPVELGWPAAAAAITVLALGGLERRRRRGDGRSTPVQPGAVAALAALAAQAAVDNPSARPAICLLAAALLGSVLARPRGAPGRRSAVARALLISIVAGAFAVADVAPYLAWREHSRLPRGALDEADRARLSRALRWNPLQPDLWLRRAEDRLGEGRERAPRDYATAREAAERAVRLQPADARYRVGLARVEGLAFGTLFGDAATRSRVSRAYLAARDLAPHDPGIPLEQGEFLLRAGDPESARRAAEAALSIEPGSVPARLLLADALLSAGGPGGAEAAARALESAVQVHERWQGHPRETAYARFHLGLDRERLASLLARIRRADAPSAGAARGGPASGDQPAERGECSTVTARALFPAERVASTTRPATVTP